MSLNLAISLADIARVQKEAAEVKQAKKKKARAAATKQKKKKAALVLAIQKQRMLKEDQTRLAMKKLAEGKKKIA